MPSTDEERVLAEELHAARGTADEWSEDAVQVEVKQPTTEVVSFRLPSETLNAIEMLAEQAGQSLSEFLRTAVTAYIAGHLAEPLIDVHLGHLMSQLRVRTMLRPPGRTEAPDSRFTVPEFPFTTVAES